jgi:DNA-binding CsgD family transcriptional regulator
MEELRSRPTPLRYPLTEAEAAQRHQGLIVSVASSGRRAAPYLTDTFKWHSYAIATMTLEGKAVGLLHAGRTGARAPVDEIDLELAVRYADGLVDAFERATLREQLQRQRAQLGSAAQWINAQVVDLSQRTKPASTALVSRHDGDLVDLLTPRELEVMRLIARGQSNRAIATSLLLGEGTIKYHVKNILRKLQARSRSEAISRFVRLYGESESS